MLNKFIHIPETKKIINTNIFYLFVLIKVNLNLRELRETYKASRVAQSAVVTTWDVN